MTLSRKQIIEELNRRGVNVEGQQSTSSQPSREEIETELKSRGVELPNQQQDSMGKAHSGIIGFNTAIERGTHGILQPLTESGILGERIKGASQQVAKNREDLYNQARKDNLYSTEIGMGLGQTAAALPSLLLGGSAAAQAIPKATPFMGYLSNILGGGLGGALHGSLQYANPGESKLENAITGLTVGAAIPGFAPAITYPAKQLSSLAKKGKESVLKTFGNKELVSKDVTKGLLPEEVSSTLKTQAAGKRLGLNLTPSESSGNPILAKTEGNLGTSPQGEKSLYKFKREQKSKQNEAIRSLLSEVSPSKENASNAIRESAKSIITKKEQELSKKAKPFYDEAYKQKIPENTFNELTKDSNIERTYKNLSNDSRYATELEGYGPNSLKRLDLVKRDLDSQIYAAKTSGDRNLARILMESKQKLVNSLDKFSPKYKEARAIYSEDAKPLESIKKSVLGEISEVKDTQLKNISKRIFDPSQTDIKVLEQVRDSISKESPEAWQRIVRQEMERRLDTKHLGQTKSHGSNFYKQILSNERDFNQFKEALKNNPKAQDKLSDMRLAFKDLINSRTVKTAAGGAENKMSAARSSTQWAKTAYDNLTGGKYDKAAIDIITDDKWTNKFLPTVTKTSGKDKGKYSLDAKKLSDLLKAASVSYSTKSREKKDE